MTERCQRLSLAGAGLLLALLPGCGDNMGRMWDPSFGGGGTTPVESSIAAPAEGDLSLAGQPVPGVVAPLGEGWHATTPAVVVFSEAVNPQSVYDEALKIERLYLREKVAQTKVRSAVDILGTGRMVILRPATGLIPNATYEIVLDAGVRDLDGTAARGAGVLGEFTITDSTTARPRVVAAFPGPGQQNSLREAPAVTVFDGPPTGSTVTTSSFYLRLEETSAAVAGSISFPLRGLAGNETRVAAFEPTAALQPSSKYGLVLTEAITVGGLALDPGAAVPFSTFTTLAWRMPTAVAVGNPVSGFPLAINLTNLERLLLDTAVTAETLPGDRLELRVYGGDPRTKGTGDLRFAQRQAAATGGAATETLDFTGALGLTTAPLLEDGAITLAARLVRGTTPGGWMVRSGVLQDLVRPTLVRFGPPAGADPLAEFWTDLQSCALFGQASEKLGKVERNGSGGDDLFASDTEGRFFLKPWDLGRTSAPTPFTLNLTDTAGNLNAAAVAGTVAQRGVLTGDVSAGSLAVEAWDLETLRPLVGATVLVEPGPPASPPVGRLTGATGASGRALFTGLVDSRHTVTVIAPGYTMASVIDTQAAFVSLPLEPLAGGGATLAGTVTFAQAAGRTAYAGCNALRNRDVGGYAATSTGAPTTIPAAALLPNRPVVLTGAAGVFPPTARPTMSAFGSPQVALSGLSTTLAPPALGAEPGTTLTAAIAAAATVQTNYGATYALDLTGKGLDTAGLASGFPLVLASATLGGLVGSVPFGVGFTTGSPASLTVDGSYSALVAAFSGLNPLLWSALEARDATGNLGRHRALFADYNLGTLVGLAIAFPTIPELTLPALSTGPPQIQWVDGLAPAGVFTTLHRVIVRDGNGRRWTLWVPDRDGTGVDTLQLPDVAASGATGLAIPSTWTVHVESWLSLLVGGGSEDLVLEDLFRLHATYARCADAACALQ